MDWTTSDFREFPKYYGDVIPSPFGSYNHGVSASGSYISFAYEKGTVGFVPSDFSTGMAEKAAQGRRAEYGSKVYTTPKIYTCSTVNNENLSYDKLGKVNHILFNPFDDDQLIAAYEQGFVLFWNLPSSYDKLGNIEEPHGVIQGLSNIYCLAHHPSAANVLAIGGNGAIYIVNYSNLQDIKILFKLKGFNDDIISIQYNSNGSLLRGITRKGIIFSYDPRSNIEDFKSVITGQVKAITMPQTLLHLNVNNNDSLILVSGENDFHEPNICIFDISKNNKANDDKKEDYFNYYDAAIEKVSYDHKNCYCLVYYDNVSNLLYLSFRTTSDLNVFHVENNGTLTKLPTYHGETLFLSFMLLPKHAIKSREINRIAKLSKDSIQLVTHTKGGKIIYQNKINKIITPKLSVDNYLNNQNAILDTIATLGTDAEDDDEKARKVSLYLHGDGKEPLNIQDRYTHIVTDKTSIALGLNVKCNSKFVVFPSQATGGGSLAIIRGKYKYRGRQNQKEIRAHMEQISTYDISLLNENLIVTGAPDAKVFVWEVPDETDEQFWGKKEVKGHQIEKKYILQHSGKVTYVGFHPTVPDVLVTAEKTQEEAILHLWDLSTGNRVSQWKNVTLKSAPIIDFQFDTAGNLAAISSGDNLVRIIDIRNKKVLLTFESLESKRDVKCFWINNDQRLLTLGFGKGSQRRLSIWDISSFVNNYYTTQGDQKENDGKNEDENENENKEENKENEVTDLQPVIEKSFGVSNAIPIGHYDRDTNLFYLTSVADRKIRVYEITDTSVNEMTGKFDSANDIMGMAFKSKFDLDVEKVEINSCYKLSKNEISQISFVIPRKRTEYFQDDLYPYSLVINQPLMSTNQWLHDKKIILLKDIPKKTLKPSNITNLSEAPPEQLSELQKRRNSTLAKMEEEKKKEGPRNAEQAFEAFSRMVADSANANRWDAQPIKSEVNEDEWSD